MTKSKNDSSEDGAMTGVLFLEDRSCREVIVGLTKAAVKFWAPGEADLVDVVAEEYFRRVQGEGQILYAMRTVESPLAFGDRDSWIHIVLPLATAFTGAMLARAGVETFKDLVARVRQNETEPMERVSAGEYDIAAIRDLIRDAFTARDLARFCQDRPVFRPVLTRCAPNASLEDMTDVLLEYCQVQILFPELLLGVKEMNPRQYERHSVHRHPSDRLGKSATEKGALAALVNPTNTRSLITPKAREMGLNSKQIDQLADLFSTTIAALLLVDSQQEPKDAEHS